MMEINLFKRYLKRKASMAVVNKIQKNLNLKKTNKSQKLFKMLNANFKYL